MGRVGNRSVQNRGLKNRRQTPDTTPQCFVESSLVSFLFFALYMSRVFVHRDEELAWFSSKVGVSILSPA